MGVHPDSGTSDEEHDRSASGASATAPSDSGPSDPGPCDPCGPLELDRPTPATARRAAAGMAAAAGFDDVAIAGLELAVSEVVTNAHLHGTAPVSVRLAVVDGAVVVSVRDRGRGPVRPPADELPPPDAVEGGRGLWLARRSVAHLTSSVDGDGHEVRLTARPSSSTG